MTRARRFASSHAATDSESRPCSGTVVGVLPVEMVMSVPLVKRSSGNQVLHCKLVLVMSVTTRRRQEGGNTTGVMKATSENDRRSGSWWCATGRLCTTTRVICPRRARILLELQTFDGAFFFCQDRVRVHARGDPYSGKGRYAITRLGGGTLLYAVSRRAALRESAAWAGPAGDHDPPAPGDA